MTRPRPTTFFLLFVVLCEYAQGLDLMDIDFVPDFDEFTPEKTNHYAFDYQKASELFQIEQTMSVQFGEMLIEKGLVRDPDCRRKFQAYLVEVNKDLTSLRVGTNAKFPLDNIADNTLLVYRLIKRLLVTLSGEIVPECVQVDMMLEIIKEEFHYQDIPFPSEADFSEASEQVLRIHYVHQFDPLTEIRLGVLGNIETNVKLNFDDCLNLGQHATRLNASVLAYQWLLAANLAFQEEVEKSTFLIQKDKQRLAKMLDDSWKRLLNLTGLKDMKELIDILRHAEKEEDWSPNFLPMGSYATCGNSRAFRKECYVDKPTHSYFAINPLKVEVFRTNPPLLQFHDFVGSKLEMQLI